MKIQERLTVDIRDMNENGMGVARCDGMVVFVPGLLMGETAEIEITAIEKNYATAVCVNRLTTSDERIQEACPDADVCGGCVLGFASYAEENRIKANAVRAALRRAGLGKVPVRETVCAEERVAYRNKIVVHYDAASNTFGFRREKSNETVPFRGCLLCADAMNEIIRETNVHGACLAPLKPTSLQLRSSPDGVTVSLYGAHTDADAFAQYRAMLMERFAAVHEVLWFGDDEPAQTTYLNDCVFGLAMQFTTEAFRQVNGAAFEKLLTVVHDLAHRQVFHRGADLYCGSGVIGLSLAKVFPASVWHGIEINRDAVRDARANAAANGIANMTFFAGDAASFRSRIGTEETPELIVVDPPRAGLSKEMRCDLTLLAPERLIYVSCNPQTMARDAAFLVESGYIVQEVTPVNLFPRTKHCECVAYCTRKVDADALVFRSATEADATEIEALYQSVIGTPFCVWNDAYPGKTDIDIDLAAGNLYVLTRGDSIVGAISILLDNELDDCGVWDTDHRAAKEIARVVIARDYRGQGLARRMVEEVAMILREAGYATLRLAVEIHHIPAQKTYENTGFRVAGRSEIFGGSYILMEKDLT